MSGDILKEKVKEIIRDYQNDFKKFVGLVKYKLRYIKKHYQEIWEKIKDSFKDSRVRTKYLTIASVFVLALILANIYSSYGYYEDKVTIPIVQAKVGNMYITDYDYTLLVYLENPNKSTDNIDYRLVSDVPITGYSYSGYTCDKDSKLFFNEDNFNASTTLEHKDVCSLYFDLVTDLDLTINIMLEDDIASDTYTVGKRIPAFGYKYDHYECSHNSELTYDSNLHKVSLSSSGKDYCSMYFKKEAADIKLNLLVENTFNMGDYINRLSIPANIKYHVNTERSSCTDKNNERLETNISYNEGYLEFATDKITACKVYLDRDE